MTEPMAKGPSDEDAWTPPCDCRECRNSDEAACAMTYFGADGERVQCGMPPHDGSCDFFTLAHEGNTHPSAQYGSEVQQ